MSTKTTTYLTLPEQVRRMAGMAAARAGVTVSEYVQSLIVADCRRSGLAALLDASRKEPEAAAPDRR